MKSLTVLLIALAFIANAENTFLIGVEELDYYPHYSVQNKEYKGFAREVFDAFAKEKGYKFDYRPLPVKRLYTSFVDGQVDFKYPDNQIWGSEYKQSVTIVYSKTLTTTADGVMVLKENFGKNSLKTLGTVLGFAPPKFLEMEKAGKIKLQNNPSLNGLVNQALIGRNDGIYINLAVGDYLLEKLGKTGELIHDTNYPTMSSEYTLSTVKYPQIIKEFDLFLEKRKEFIASLVKKYKIK